MLALAAALACFACVDEAPPPSPAPASADAGGDARSGGDGGVGDALQDAPVDGVVMAAPECFKGTPKTNEELLNACWEETVTAVIKKATLPGGYVIGTTLPPPPP